MTQSLLLAQACFGGGLGAGAAEFKGLTDIHLDGAAVVFGRRDIA